MDYVKKYLNVGNSIGEGAFGKVLVTSLIQNQQQLSPTQSTNISFQSSPQNETRFALKCINSILKPQRLVSELRFLRDLGGHNNVVQMHSAYFQDGALYIVMDLIDHDRFSDFVRNLDCEEIRMYMKNLLIALEWVHSRNIIHRDIKPANFLFNRKQRKFLLVDFGLAQPARKNCLFGPNNVSPNTGTPSKLNQISNSMNRSNLRPISNGMLQNPNALSPMTTSITRAQTHLNCSNFYGKPIINNKLDQRQTIMNSPFMNPKPIQSPAKRLINFSPTGPPTTPNISTKRLMQPNETNDSIQMLKKLRVSNTEDLREPVRLTVGAYESPVTNNDAKSARNRNNQDNHIFSTPKVPSRHATAKCDCRGKPKTCGHCMSRPESNVSRSGTPGYKAPEILLRSSVQTTALDIWSAGVIMLCLFSAKPTMFRDLDDVNSLAEIITILGSERIIQAGKDIGVRLDIQPPRKPQSLKYVCQVCRSSQSNHLNPELPECAYDLLSKMLEPNPLIRITASDALRHPWFSKPIEDHISTLES